MTGARERWLTPVDLRLLAALTREPTLVGAAAASGIGRDRAVYRLRRLARLYGRPAALGEKGGRAPGRTRLTALGRRLLAEGGGPRPTANRWRGRFRAGRPPLLAVDGGGELAIGRAGRAGTVAYAEIDPESVVVGRSRVRLSTRNVLPATVRAVRRRADGNATLVARWGPREVRAAITSASVAELGLIPGRRVYLYVKATAVRIRPVPGGDR